jgi:CubicO group peptidase (beta-lactamase class C family)
MLLICISSCIPVQIPSAKPISQDAITAIDDSCRALAEEGRFSGSVLIAQGDRILLSEGFGSADLENNIPNTPRTRFHLGSVTKQFTAMAVLILQSRGELSVEDPVCGYVPDCPEHWQEITIHQLLTHSSGLPDSWRFYAGRDVTDMSHPPQEIIAWFKSTPLDFEPGTRFAYSNTGYVLLGVLIEEVSGQTYISFLRQNIFQPLGMNDTGYGQVGADLAVGYREVGVEAPIINASLAFSAGGLFSTVEDLYRWDQALYSDDLLPHETMTSIFTSHISTPPRPYSPPYDNLGYGYGWFIGEFMGHRVASHGGTYSGYLAQIERFLDDTVTIIILSNLEGSDLAVTTLPAERIFAE